MTRIIRAELIRFARRHTMIIAAAVTVTFSIVTTLAVFSSAQSSGIPDSRGQTTLAVLGDHGGGTEAFALGGAFAGFFVFATFIAILAGEFSGGTFRALLLRDPRRIRVIIGKFAGILIIAATIVAFAEVSTFVVSLLVAPTKDIEISDWFSADSMVAGLGNYATVLGGVAGWAVFGTTLAVIIRSVPLAIGVGIAWSGPFENIVAQIVGTWIPVLSRPGSRVSHPTRHHRARARPRDTHGRPVHGHRSHSDPRPRLPNRCVTAADPPTHATLLQRPVRDPATAC